MSDEEEDYLSDKFLVESTSSQPKTYAQRRQESLKQSHIKNVQNRLKGRRQREQESREEGLRKSLFEETKEDGSKAEENKALGIMLKMGFKIGSSLGRPAEDDRVAEQVEPSESTHITEPIPLNEWSGKRGIGLGKRSRSPGASERLAKMAKMAEDASRESFRDFARREYEERRAEGRLIPARRTCMTLDEQAGVLFNVLWVDPNDADSIPKGLMGAISEYTQDGFPTPSGKGNEATRLRDQMRADALQPIPSTEGDPYDYDGTNKATRHEDFSLETVEEAVSFFRLRAQDRLSLVLAYLRDKHAYCFWCGTKYESDSELEKYCPGSTEEDHD